MELASNASYYPKAGCYRIGRILYDVRNISYEKKTFWEILVQRGVVNRHTYVEAGRNENCTVYIWSSAAQQHMLILRQGRATSLTLDTMMGGVRPMVHVWRIQRAIRMFLWRKRCIALAMGLHVRLGTHSQMMELDSDLMALILR